jgi:hypothetical protein
VLSQLKSHRALDVYVPDIPEYRWHAWDSKTFLSSPLYFIESRVVTRLHKSCKSLRNLRTGFRSASGERYIRSWSLDAEGFTLLTKDEDTVKARPLWDDLEFYVFVGADH